jgi:hypothetical protein
MGCTKRTAHCGHILLAEVVVLFSQQIICRQKAVVATLGYKNSEG